MVSIEVISIIHDSDFDDSVLTVANINGRNMNCKTFSIYSTIPVGDKGLTVIQLSRFMLMDIEISRRASYIDTRENSCYG